MRIRSRSLTWRGQPFHFDYVLPSEPMAGTPVWAVSRRGEFIGMMPDSGEITTKEFDVRCARWLGDLLNTRSSARPGEPPG
jgi:hypothetical protein